MPILTYATNTELSPERANWIAAALTSLTALHLDKDPDLTVVRVHAGASAGAWHVAGSAAGQPIAAVEIQITEGSNTARQKAAWLKGVAEMLELPATSSPSYLTILEIPSESWGYNGISQSQRKAQHDEQVRSSRKT